jgi:hypothetical protein
MSVRISNSLTTTAAASPTAGTAAARSMGNQQSLHGNQQNQNQFVQQQQQFMEISNNRAWEISNSRAWWSAFDAEPVPAAADAG